MVKCEKLHYALRQRLNTSGLNNNKPLTTAQADFYLNCAKEVILENLATMVEVNPELRNILRQVEVKNHCITKVEGKDPNTKTVKLPSNYYRGLRVWGIACKDGCEDERVIDFFSYQTQHLNNAVKNPYLKSSWDYEEAIYDEGEDGIYVYVNDDEFRLKKVCMDYIRKIPDIRCPEFDECEYLDECGDVVKDNIDFEIDDPRFFKKMVDYAALTAHRDMGQVDDFQTQSQLILFGGTHLLRNN